MDNEKMKNDIKFIIPNKFLVDINFKKVLQPFEICELNDLLAIDNIDRIFDFAQMSDDALIDYYNNYGKMNSHDKTVKVGEADFKLDDIDYSYSYDGGKLGLESKLVYKSPDDLFGGTGKFTVDLSAVIEIPDKATDTPRTLEHKLTFNIAGETFDFSNHKITDILSTCSLIDFNSYQCNAKMPDNIRIVTDESTDESTTEVTTSKIVGDMIYQDKSYFKYDLLHDKIFRAFFKSRY